MPQDEFVKAEDTFKEGSVFTSIEKINPNQSLPLNKPTKGGGIEYHKKLVKEYHSGKDSLVKRLEAEGKNGIEPLLYVLIEEMLGETDNLLGNRLIATQNGDIRDATIISDKRASVIAQVMKAVQQKQEFEKEKGGFDIASPSMKVVFEYFMRKVRDSFKSLNYNDEQSDIFFRSLGTSMLDWQKELKADLAAINSIGSSNVKK